METKKMKTLMERLHEINVHEEDVDLTVDGEYSIAVCSPVTFTEEGLRYWSECLTECTCDGDLVTGSEEDCEEAYNLLASLAGYCSVKSFNRWFEGGKEI